MPKWKSFDYLKRDDVTLIVNHINSIAKASLNEKTPFELAKMLLNNELLSALELQKVSYDEFLLKPILLKN